jgi:outer membrane immunogenic protein
VLGAEADWQWSLQKDSVCISECLPAAVAGTLVALTDEQTLKWFGTARARFGWVAPSGALWYATGGAAWARIDQTLSLIAVPGVPFFAVGSTNAASFSHNKAGWTVGGGVEIPLWNRFTAKAEYLYVDLGSVTNSFTTALDPNIALGPQTTTSSSAIRDHIVRFGLDYHFN